MSPFQCAGRGGNSPSVASGSLRFPGRGRATRSAPAAPLPQQSWRPPSTAIRAHAQRTACTNHGRWTQAWLDPVHLPSYDSLSCPFSGKPLQFLLQVYAPVEGEASFHRALYLFISAEVRLLPRTRCAIHPRSIKPTNPGGFAPTAHPPAYITLTCIRTALRGTRLDPADGRHIAEWLNSGAHAHTLHPPPGTQSG
jgi:hypothetical protein